MKRLTAIALAVCLLFTGCGWMEGSYASIVPHQQHSGGNDSQVLVAENYLQIRTALENMVSSGIQSNVISVANFQQEQLRDCMDMAVLHVKNAFPIGAYAVEDITYEVGAIGEKSAVAVEIIYRHERSEIQKIQQVPDMTTAQQLIGKALSSYDASLVLLIGDYQQTDIHQMVDDYAEANPGMVMEVPEVAVQLYPDTGRVRVLELKFTFQSSRDSLRSMQEVVQRIFNSAALYVSRDAADSQKLSQLYSFLMERFNEYQIKTSITPAYSLLNHGVGDSSAFSIVYAEMCEQAGLTCHVVVGTRNGEPWYWNIVCNDGFYYHVDLLASLATGNLQLMTDEEMEDYVWDYSAYPACIGTPPQETTGTPENPPEETTVPQDPSEPEETTESEETSVPVETTEPIETTVPETSPENNS